MYKKKSLNQEALERIKGIYSSYIESNDCNQIGNIDEVIEADKLFYKLLKKNLSQSCFEEAEDAMTHYGNCSEMQGFIYGFSCAMRLMAQSL